MALIFVLSSDSDPGPDLGGMQETASYLAHAGLYAALWTSLSWALGWRWPALAFVVTVLYGVSDEVHQSFVEGRDASPLDVVADAVGAAAAWALTARLRSRSRRRPAASRPRPGTATGPNSR